MKITLEQLKAHNACTKGLDYFKANFGEEAEADEVIKKLLDEKTTANWIEWLATEFKLTTICKYWYENGQLREEFYYKNGKRDGDYKIWYTNGQLAEECFYKNGEKDGTYKYWHENGQLREECYYKNGELDGT